MTDSNHVVGLVLAAGGSRRLGQPKQLVEYQGKPLITRAVEQLLFAGCSSVITVLGANANIFLPAIEHLPTRIVINGNWPMGIGNSISFALQHVDCSAAGLLISLCDQPLIETEHYRQLIHLILSGGHSIVATEYPCNQSGVPAAFANQLYDQLNRLEGDIGARKIIQTNNHFSLKPIGRVLDIDTQQDLETLASHNESFVD